MPSPPFKPQWYHATRLFGAVCFLYGLLIDHSPDRATLILTGAGLMGLDKVARAETPKKDD